MRLRKKILTIVIISSMICGLVGCGNVGANSGSNSSGSMSVAENKFISRNSIQKFENFHDMFNTRFTNFIGKIDLVDDYAVEGKNCAKIDVVRLTSEASLPTIYMDVKDKWYNYDFSDLSMVDYVGFYIFNGNDFDSKIKFTITGEYGNELLTKQIKLPAQNGSNCRFRIDRLSMAVKEEKAVCFKFELDCSSGVWYMDDMYLEKAYEPVKITKKDFSGSDLLSFNSLNDISCVYADSTIVSKLYDTEISISSDSVIKDGYALKISYSKNGEIEHDESLQPNSFYSGVSIVDKLVKSFDFNRLKSSALKADVLLVSDIGANFIIRVKDVNDSVYDKIIPLKPNEWTTVSLTESDMNDSTVIIDKIKKLSFLVEYAYLNDGTTLYLDTVRTEELG